MCPAVFRSFRYPDRRWKMEEKCSYNSTSPLRLGYYSDSFCHRLECSHYQHTCTLGVRWDGGARKKVYKRVKTAIFRIAYNLCEGIFHCRDWTDTYGGKAASKRVWGNVLPLTPKIYALFSNSTHTHTLSPLPSPLHPCRSVHAS